MLQKITNFLFPHTCLLCREKSDLNMDLCAPCKNDLPFMPHACRYCAMPIAEGAEVCGECLKKTPIIDDMFALFSYEAPIAKLITSLKFQQHLTSSRLLGELMAEKLIAHLPKIDFVPQCIIPVPLHPRRLLMRGFNQAVELARPIAKQLPLPLEINACLRVKHTAPQTSLPAKQRQRNLKQAFAVNSDFKYQSVAIVDDVFTTGGTVLELAKCLKKTGVQQIAVWCCARTS